jgi:ribosome biogenesis GTPase
MNLEDFGYDSKIAELRNRENLEVFELGRVIAEHKERYIVKTNKGEMEAEITGNLRFSANGREDFPAVGDWVALLPNDDPDFGIIHKILPRFSQISRKAVGRSGEIQIIGTNIHYAFLVQAVDRDFNMNRLERYLTICYSSKVKPIIVLTKTDLIEESHKTEIIKSINERLEDIAVFAISNETQDGYEALNQVFEKGKTYCMVGSSGVGKSSLLNNLSGKQKMKTDVISQSTNKGRHVTSHRELVVLENGSILIDNPGMREVGIGDIGSGLESTYNKIDELSENCRFRDCSHTNENGCAVIEAIENGEIEDSRYQNYLKLQREKAHFESSLQEKRAKDKDFGKMVKNFKKGLHKRKY